MIRSFLGLAGAVVQLAVWFPAAADKRVSRKMAFRLANSVRRLPVKLVACHAVGSPVTVVREAR